MKQTPLGTLHKYFGYSSFRPGQIDIIRSIISGHDAMGILPTGGGKSICFQIPGLILPGITIVVSPLISLMKDQVDQLKKHGVAASYINSSLQPKKISDRIFKLSQNQIKFCYVAPERLNTTSFLQACSQVKVSLLVIDEAHCISEWGHDFRPSYLAITQFITKLSVRPIVVAFTATATKRVGADIINSLQLIKPQQFSQGFCRHNLHFTVQECASRYQKEVWLFRILKLHRFQSGIIYTMTRESTEYLADLLNHFHISAVSYHAGLTQNQRAKIQDQFIKGDIPIIVATNAFGMGIDKPDVRFVIHYHLPGSLENYYQEAGRAGRDRLKAHCYLLFCPRDISIVKTLIQPNCETHQDEQKLAQWKIKLAQLEAMVNYASIKTCRIKYIIQYFGDHPAQITCKQCDSCRPPKLIRDTEKLVLQKLDKYLHQPKHPSLNQLQQLALHQPHSLHDLLQLPGWGRGLIERWGEQVLATIDEETH